MTQDDDLKPTQLPAVSEISLAFTAVSPVFWRGVATCPHGYTVTSTFLTGPGAPRLNATAMVSSCYRQHDLLIGCDCIRQAPILDASVTYTPTAGVAAGEQRVILEQSATIVTATNFNFYGRLTCLRGGCYYVDATIKLAGTVRSGARGTGQFFASGTPPMISAPMVDVANAATATLQGMVNLTPNQPLALAYMNTSAAPQDVTSASLTISDVWLP